MLNKVIVIGSPGAGKSTFSRKLRDVTGLPLYYHESEEFLRNWGGRK